ncbi:hypothetical protein GCM10009794_17660 [Rothia terrae]
MEQGLSGSYYFGLAYRQKAVIADAVIAFFVPFLVYVGSNKQADCVSNYDVMSVTKMWESG